MTGCLPDAPVRPGSGHGCDRFLTGPLAHHVDWVPVRPEMEIGLGASRPRLRLRTDELGAAKDETAGRTWAMTALENGRILDIADVDGYVFDPGSPSCALLNLPRYASGLNDPVLREHFVERVFARAGLREFFARDRRPRDLVAFHSRHKLQVLAHDPSAYRELGRIVAGAGTRGRGELEADYRRAFDRALAVPPKRGRHTNALLHVLGPMSEHLDPARRHDIVAAIESYRRGEAPLSVPIALLRHHAEAEHLDYLSQQTYLNPFPPDLVPRHHL
ncbi:MULTISPECIES: DUF1722 domain-containing protein [unclassified Spirillospora]|uniref:DUF1722 domain-containing protein n=1 Tax=unclassified Spirillospora TaxID=2642701 RepID=UPI00372489EE